MKLSEIVMTYGLDKEYKIENPEQLLIYDMLEKDNDYVITNIIDNKVDLRII